MKRRRAIVIGGSLGGLFAANMLRTVGWDAHVYERVDNDLASRGAGIGTDEEMFHVMRRMGIAVDDSIGVYPTARVCLDRSGRVVREGPVPRMLSSWGRIYRALKDALPEERYHFTRTLTRYDAYADGVIANFSDGTRAEGDLLVGADGIRSTVRAQLLPDVEPRYAGYVAWRGVVDEAALRPALHAEIFHRYLFCLPEGEMVIAYPVPGPNNDLRAGGRSYNVVWYHPVPEEKLRDISTDAAGRHHKLGIAPQLIRPDVVDEIRRIARDVLAPQLAELVDAVPQIFFQAIYDLESPRMAQQRVALLGDAAFVARPHVGVGVTKAALDAEALGDALCECDHDIDSALERYDEKQRLFGTRVVERARRLGAHLEAQVTKPRELRTPEELYQEPEVVMREIGRPLRDTPEIKDLLKPRQK